jgi:outer membrane biogenesis lipoprotein LolB
MKYLLPILAVLLLSSCTAKIKSCQANPTIQQAEQKKTEETTTEKNKDILDKINEQVVPGAQVKCSF